MRRRVSRTRRSTAGGSGPCTSVLSTWNAPLADAPDAASSGMTSPASAYATVSTACRMCAFSGCGGADSSHLTSQFPTPAAPLSAAAATIALTAAACDSAAMLLSRASATARACSATAVCCTPAALCSMTCCANARISAADTAPSLGFTTGVILARRMISRRALRAAMAPSRRRRPHTSSRDAMACAWGPVTPAAPTSFGRYSASTSASAMASPVAQRRGACSNSASLGHTAVATSQVRSTRTSDPPRTGALAELVLAAIARAMDVAVGPRANTSQ